MFYNKWQLKKAVIGNEYLLSREQRKRKYPKDVKEKQILKIRQ